MCNFTELNYFITIAKTNSFVKASNLLNVSASALSHSMKNLESRLNLRLLNRSTRNVSLTEAGQQLYHQIEPLFKSISNEVNFLNDFLDTPSGTIRINASMIAVEIAIYPKLSELLRKYPKINIEIIVDNGWADIIKQGFDIGCRLGKKISQDMIAVQISPPLKMVLVASPSYIKNKNKPTCVEDLTSHDLIGMKISAQHGNEVIWEFNDNGNVIEFLPKPKLSINNDFRKIAVLDGLGIGWFSYLGVKKELSKGELIELLPDFSMIYEPYYIYYPSRKGHSNAFKLIIDTLKYKK